jgi:hypothetical protein
MPEISNFKPSTERGSLRLGWRSSSWRPHGNDRRDFNAMHEEDTDLPPEIADRFTIPFARLLEIKVATGIMLFVATVAALILSNSK